MNYSLELNSRAFQAIKNGTKKIEGRVQNSYDKVDFKDLKKGDMITFENISTKEKMKVKIDEIRHYPNVKAMLEAEGTRNVLSTGGNIKQGIESYNKISEYKKNILKYGIYAIEIQSL